MLPPDPPPQRGAPPQGAGNGPPCRGGRGRGGPRPRCGRGAPRSLELQHLGLGRHPRAAGADRRRPGGGAPPALRRGTPSRRGAAGEPRAEGRGSPRGLFGGWRGPVPGRLTQGADLQAVAVAPLEEDGLGEGSRPPRAPREAHHDRLVRRDGERQRGALPGQPLADREAVDRQLLGLPPRVDHLEVQGPRLARSRGAAEVQNGHRLELLQAQRGSDRAGGRRGARRGGGSDEGPASGPARPAGGAGGGEGPRPRPGRARGR